MEEGLINQTNEIEELNRMTHIFCMIGIFIILFLIIGLVVINYLFIQKIWI
jgi:predicted negative regulator of RcsB-dependent stress response